MFNIVLVEPEIPQNAGNIIRTCACTGCKLHLVKPLGFSLDDKYYKRAGLDYFDKASIFMYENLQSFLQEHENSSMYFLSTKAKKLYTQPQYREGDFFVFGKESAGLSETLLENRYDSAVRIPMRQSVRSLNLSNSVAIVVYEALRQNNFSCSDMQFFGELTGRGY